MRRFTRFACVDWSGAKGERNRGLAVAVCEAGDTAPMLEEPPNGKAWSRAEILNWLLAQSGTDILIGIDFSPSLPLLHPDGFFRGVPNGPRTARELWRYVDRHSLDLHFGANGLVAKHADHFRVGGITGTYFSCPDSNGHLRETERQAQNRLDGIRPSSCFNLVGASQVGKSSLTGMRVLHALDGRIPIWPFDDSGDFGPLLVEIYTSIAARAASGPGCRGTKLNTVEALNEALTSRVIASGPYPGSGKIADHASDALLTAAWLRRAADDPALWSPQGIDAVRHTEGWTFGVP